MHAHEIIKSRGFVKKFAPLALLALLLAGLTGSCVHGHAESEPHDYPEPLTRPLFWSAEKGGKVTYLLGTVHVGVDAEKELPPSVWQAFRRSRCFVMESDQDAVNPREMVKMATLPNGETLQSKVKPETWKKLQTDLAGKLPRGLLAKSQPWFVTIVYLQQEVPKGLPMDGVLENRARRQGKKIYFLEDWKAALAAFASVTDASDLDDLVLNGDQTEKETDELIAAYRSGDEATVEKAVKEIDAETPNADAKMRVLLDGRNTAWMPNLLPRAAQGTCFVAVGAGHLVGTGNLRERLAAKGYKITRLGGGGT